MVITYNIPVNMSSKLQILKLYKTLLRESQKFTAYNFRKYAVRRVQDAFRENQKLTDENLIMAQIEEANRNLEIIRRQVVIGQMYRTEKLVIENIIK